MADQEFSSPGEHMASLGGGSSRVVDAGRSNGTGPGESGYHSSNVIWSPGAFDNLNRGYQVHHDEVYGSSARERAERFNDRYMQYNNDLFTTAMEYDKYMSNTAIQRQVEDLKKAGLNPILASRLGGAVYKGVNAPYLSISPASALGNYLDFGASMYQTDVNAQTQIETTRLQNNSREFIAQYDKVMDLYMQGNLFEHQNELVELERDCQRYLDSMKALDNQQLQNLGFENQKALDDFNYDLQRQFYELKFSKENFGAWSVKLGNLITGISPFATLSQANIPSFSSNPIGFTN